MPTQQSKRIVVLQSSFNATPVSTLNLTMNAVFTTTAAATNKFEDVSADNTEDKTKYRMKFVNAAGAEIGSLTLRLVAKGDPATGVTLSKTGRSTIVPGPTVPRGADREPGRQLRAHLEAGGRRRRRRRGRRRHRQARHARVGRPRASPSARP
jgi:hypothetical protein